MRIIDIDRLSDWIRRNTRNRPQEGWEGWKHRGDIDYIQEYDWKGLERFKIYGVKVEALTFKDEKEQLVKLIDVISESLNTAAKGILGFLEKQQKDPNSRVIDDLSKPYGTRKSEGFLVEALAFPPFMDCLVNIGLRNLKTLADPAAAREDDQLAYVEGGGQVYSYAHQDMQVAVEALRMAEHVATVGGETNPVLALASFFRIIEAVDVGMMDSTVIAACAYMAKGTSSGFREQLAQSQQGRPLLGSGRTDIVKP